MHEGPTEPYEPNTSEDLEDAVLWYLQAVENGERPEVEAFLGRYPHLREELLKFLEDEDLLDDWYEPVRPPILHPVHSEVPPGLFGDYQLIEVIGRGGMGIVYKTKHLKLNRIVALKMIRTDQILTMTDLQRFRSEAESVARLDHPHIIPIYEVDDHHGRPYFTMKLIEGGTVGTRLDEYQLPQLRKKSRKDKKGNVYSRQDIRERKAKIAKLLATIADAVHHAHQRRIIHRDLKPSNILMDEKGTPYVSDLGLAIPIQTKSEKGRGPQNSKPDANDKATQDRSTTQHGQIAGTLNYMAPEQALGRQDLSSAVDVFSLGVILYQLTTGSLPFSEPEDDLRDPAVCYRILEKVRECQPQRPRERNPWAIDKDLEAICLKSMEKKPEDRYVTALALANDLDRYQQGKPVRARPTHIGVRLVKSYRRKPVVGTLWAVLVIGSILGLAVLLRQFRLTRAALAESQRSEYRLGVGTAYIVLKQGLLEHGKTVLEECPENLRNWEWRFLNRWAQGKVVYSPEQESEVRVVACSPDGKLIASASYDGVIKLWDYPTLQEVANFQQEVGEIDSLEFSPDGRWIITASTRDKQIRVWEVSQSKRELKPIPQPQQPVRVEGEVVAFHPNGTLVAVGGGVNKSALALWKFHDGTLRLKKSIKNCGVEIEALSFLVSETGPTHIYVGGAVEDETVRVLSVPELNELRSQNIHTGTYIYALAVHPKGTYFAASTQGTASFWNTKTLEQFHLPSSVNHALCKGIMFSHKGEYLAAVLRGTVTVWSVPQAGRQVFDVRRSQSHLTGLAFHPDDNVLVYPAEKQFALENWKSPHALAVQTFRVSNGPVRDIAFGPHGQYLATVSGDGIVHVRDLSASSKKGRELKATNIVSIAFNPSDASLACGSKDGKVSIYDVNTGNRQSSFAAHSKAVTDLLYQTESTLVTSSEDRTIHVWELSDLVQPRLTIPCPAPVNAIAWNQARKTLAVGGKVTAPLRRYDLSAEDWKNTLRDSPAKDIWSVAYSDDETRLATADVKGFILVWDVRSGERLHKLTGHSGAVYDVAFASGGERLVSAGLDGTVKVWSTITGKEILSLKAVDSDPFARQNFGHALARCLAFDPKGYRLAVGHDDGTVILRDGSPSP